MRSRALAFDGAKSAWPDLKILNEQKETAACDARARARERSSTALHNDFYFLPPSFLSFRLASLSLLSLFLFFLSCLKLMNCKCQVGCSSRPPASASAPAAESDVLSSSPRNGGNDGAAGGTGVIHPSIQFSRISNLLLVGHISIGSKFFVE